MKDELSCFSFDITYCPAKENDRRHSRWWPGTAPPGRDERLHIIRIRNLPFSVEGIKWAVKTCQIFTKFKPRFYKPNTEIVIKPAKSFERLSLDLKWPLPSKTRNKYILTLIHKYSHFPFPILYPDIIATIVMQALCLLFAVFALSGDPPLY